MAKRKVKTDDEQLAVPFDFEKGVKVGHSGLTKEVLARAKANAHVVDAKRAAKVLMSVRYEEGLLLQVKELARIMRLPYQTLMNELLKTGLETMSKSAPAGRIDFVEFEERLAKVEHELTVLRKASAR